MPNTRRQLFRSSAGFATLHTPLHAATAACWQKASKLMTFWSVRSNAKVSSLTYGLHCIPGHNELQFHWLIECECEFVCVCECNGFVLRNW